ncbi:hypothetical protein [Halothiobacillus diazotrophicus]|nr:hypothetical protein [Halothiobacillus diazotrophicus]
MHINHEAVIVVSLVGLGLAMAVHFASRYRKPLRQWAVKHLRRP